MGGGHEVVGKEKLAKEKEEQRDVKYDVLGRTGIEIEININV